MSQAKHLLPYIISNDVQVTSSTDIRIATGVWPFYESLTLRARWRLVARLHTRAAA